MLMSIMLCYRRWKVVSHPETVNPFEHASFVNYIATIRLHPITVGNLTYIDWTGAPLNVLMGGILLCARHFVAAATVCKVIH